MDAFAKTRARARTSGQTAIGPASRTASRLNFRSLPAGPHPRYQVCSASALRYIAQMHTALAEIAQSSLRAAPVPPAGAGAEREPAHAPQRGAADAQSESVKAAAGAKLDEGKPAAIRWRFRAGVQRESKQARLSLARLLEPLVAQIHSKTGVKRSVDEFAALCRHDFQGRSNASAACLAAGAKGAARL